jgi:hypothetical protein
MQKTGFAAITYYQQKQCLYYLVVGVYNIVYQKSKAGSVRVGIFLLKVRG